MQKRRRPIVTLAVIIIVCTVILGVAVLAVSAYSSANIDHKLDEALFAAARSETVTRLYYDTSEYSASDINNYIAAEYEEVSYGGVRKTWYSYSELSEYLKEGFVAMEDRSFWSHGGVDVKRSAGAALNYIIGRDSYGGSTITQQVVKNISGDAQHTLKRKLNEIIRSRYIENTHTKEEIFEVYLNVIPMSENVAGVGAAAEEYFGKHPSELDIAEAATLIGIANAPSRYNPYNNPEACIKKRNVVLGVMWEQGCITEEEYRNALSEPLKLTKRREADGEVASWFAETVLGELADDLVEKRGMSREAARLLVYKGGLSVYTTVDPRVQRILEDYFSDAANFPEAVKEGLEYAMAVSSSLTGDLVAIVGSTGRKSANKILNYAEVPHIPGSVLKPLALYAPLIDRRQISWSSVFDDVPVSFTADKEGGFTEYPHNYPNVYSGLTTVADALRLSKNTVAVRLYNMLGAEEIYRMLTENYGLGGIVKSMNTERGTVTDLASSPLALGQLSFGLPLRSLTEAYTVFPREGRASQGRSYLTAYCSDGSLLINNTAKDKSALSAVGARVMSQLMMGVTDSGTAAKITLKELFDVAGKTGTSGGDKDRWFIGFTPYYTAGIWCGYKNSEKSVGNHTKNHLTVWDEVMHKVHGATVGSNEQLKHFSTEGLIYSPYCKDSGGLYSLNCMEDVRGCRKDYGYFIKGTEPTSLCNRHILCRYDTASEGVDFGQCPEEYVKLVALLDISDRAFPKQIYVTDAQYVYRKIGSQTPMGSSYDVPFFEYAIPEGEYVGISRGKKQFNSACYIHG